MDLTLIQFLAWLLALSQAITAVYLLILNLMSPVNHRLAWFFTLLSAQCFLAGLLVAGASQPGAKLFAALLAGIHPATYPALLLATLALLISPELQKRLRWLTLTALAVMLIPAVLVLLDLNSNTRLWFTWVETSTPTGEWLGSITQGQLAPLVQAVIIALPQVTALFAAAYSAWMDRKASPAVRRSAALLVITLVTTGMVALFFDAGISTFPWLLALSALTFLGYAAAGVLSLIAERRLLYGRLKPRLVLLSAAATLPILAAGIAYMGHRSMALLDQSQATRLQMASDQTARAIDSWLADKVALLQALAATPEISSMQPGSHRQVLNRLVDENPEITFAATFNSQGLSLARSDDGPSANYGSELWFERALSGETPVLSSAGRLENATQDLLIAIPLRASDEKLVGVGVIASPLENLLAGQVESMRTNGAVLLILDGNGATLASTSDQVALPGQNLAEYPPGQAFLTGAATLLHFQDRDGAAWRAALSRSASNLGVIVLLPEEVWLAPAREVRLSVWMSILVGVVLVIALTWFTIQQNLAPVASLQKAATAISAGELSQPVPVESEDEFGELARAVNNVTGQVRELVTSLERRVIERTRDLERRSVQLQVAAEVAREAAAIRNMEELLDHTVRLISDRFGYYHSGIFLVDDVGEYAVLRAASSEGGMRMLKRQHRLRIGQVGIVGYVAGHGAPRIALDVGADATFFNNPDLPKTRSELALPLIVRGDVIGVLDVQSVKASAFSEEDVSILQVLADQVALAIDNARLLQESQQAIGELEKLYSEQLGVAWQDYLANKQIAYVYDRMGVGPVSEGTSLTLEPSSRVLNLPIELRGQRLGYLQLQRDEDQPDWKPEETELLRKALAQLALALENARLFEINRMRAQNEKAINEVAGRLQSSLSLETVMKSTVQQIGESLRAARVRLRLIPTQETLQPAGVDSASLNDRQGEG